jgi:hypothetical protein
LSGFKDAAALRNAGLAASVLVFAWPQLSALAFGTPTSFPLLTAAVTLLMVALVVTWPQEKVQPPRILPRALSPAVLIAAMAGAAVLAFALYRLTDEVMWQGHRADMLIVIREATRRFLNGHNPYTTYRTYDAQWNMALPYGPAMWGPFLVPQLLHLDFRIVAVIGALFIPVWCGVAASVEAARGRLAGAASWLAVLAALVFALDLSKFTLIGHTPVYWPLLPLFAVMVVRGRWLEAACLLGVLVVARTTMVALIPVFLMAVWSADRRRLPAAAIALALTTATALAPFIVWDYRALWDGMIASYPRVMKAAVWESGGRGAIDTVGVTGWLLARHREWLVMPVQVAVMIGMYIVTWPAIRRGARPLPWMALALLAFSMTTLWPVYYIYYDVLLLLISAALVETLKAGPVPMSVKPWLISLTVLVVLTAATIRIVASPFPSIAAGEVAPGLPLRAGFALSEFDGQRHFAWIERNEATIILPRSSASAADIVLTAQSPIDPTHPPQRVTAVLNGNMLAQTAVRPGWQEIRFAAPASAWWIGFNELHLVFSTTVSPREAGMGDDARHLALGVSRVDVMPQKK